MVLDTDLAADSPARQVALAQPGSCCVTAKNEGVGCRQSFALADKPTSGTLNYSVDDALVAGHC